MTSTPIIAGFYPDPSICRAGDTYYIANSTCQYLPGIPLHASTDLLHWEPVGNAFSRPEQLNLSTVPSNAGLYAPTLRYHKGTFYIVTTDIGTAQQGHLIVHASDPAGPWSDPVRTTGAVGIDPDLSWDTDGTCYLTWKGLAALDKPMINTAAIDPQTGELQGEVRQIWQGSGNQASPESPHLFRRGDYYYTTLAEGGTGPNHSVTIARARSLEGPWEAHPDNPIFTHRGTTSPVQNAGHADFVEHADGTWSAVYLGVRPRGFTPGFHVNGRETFLADITWTDDWPTFSERYPTEPALTAFADDFVEQTFHSRWISHGGAHWTHTNRTKAGLGIRPRADNPEIPVLAVRTRDESWVAEIAVSGSAALQVHLDTNNWAELGVDGREVSVTLCSVGIRHVIAEQAAEGDIEGLLITAVPWPSEAGLNQGPDQLVFSLRTTQGTEEIARFDGRLLSTEVTAGFVGRTVGVRALGAACLIRSFRYAPTGMKPADAIPI